MTPRHARRVHALPGWWSTVAEAEQSTMRAVARDDILSACTHAVDGIAVVTLELMPGLDPLGLSGATPPGQVGHLAELAHQNRWSGRAFVFEGQSNLRAGMTVGDVLDATAVDVVALPGSGNACPPELVVVDPGDIRPTYRDGGLVLLVRPGAPGTVVPFERRPDAARARPVFGLG